ncbi:MAG TPA: peptidoglycan-binding domain-containing protein [Pyrinomonadaceae bacterium]|nr:peptidoglycan-binding domain-containing protein [Pyrinomonadaceae bacterium]
MLKRSISIFALLLLVAGGAIAQGTGATPAPSPEKAKTTRFTPTKAQITEGQTKLKDAKLYSGAADGKYNDDTRAAIRTYQKDNGLEVTGNFNRATVEKMGIALTDSQKGIATTAKPDDKPKTTTDKPTTTADGPKKPAPFQATEEQITALQTKLKEAKLFDGAADGKRSDAFKASVKKYQEANSLNATGGVNAATLEKAGIALTDKQKEQVKAQAAYDAAKAKTN